MVPDVGAWLQQLYAPLNYFGNYYRTIQRQLIDCPELLATNAGLTVGYPSHAMPCTRASDVTEQQHSQVTVLCMKVFSLSPFAITAPSSSACPSSLVLSWSGPYHIWGF